MKAKQANKILRGGYFFTGFEKLVRIDKEEYDRQVVIQNNYFSVSLPGAYIKGSVMCTPKIMTHLFGHPTNIKNHYLHWYFGGYSSSLMSGMKHNGFNCDNVLIPLSIVEAGRADSNNNIHRYTIGAHEKLSEMCVNTVTGIITTHLLKSM